jgi:hypothetical protein
VRPIALALIVGMSLAGLVDQAAAAPRKHMAQYQPNRAQQLRNCGWGFHLGYSGQCVPNHTGHRNNSGGWTSPYWTSPLSPLNRIIR